MCTDEKKVLWVCVHARSARLVARTRQRSVQGTENAPSPTCFIINMSEELVPEPSDSSSFLWRSVGAFNSAQAFDALIQPLYLHLFW